MILDIYGLLFAEILSRDLEAFAVAFGVNLGQRIDFFLRHCVKKFRRPDLVLSDIFAEAVQIPKVREIGVHDDPVSKIKIGVHQAAGPLLHHVLTVIVDVGTQDPLYIVSLRQLFAAKGTVHFEEKFQSNGHIPGILLVREADASAKLRIEER